MITAISQACQMDLSYIGRTQGTLLAFPDMHCPDLPGDANFWSASCLAKTSDPLAPCARKRCPVGNAIRAKNGLGPVVVKPTATEDEKEAAKQARRAERLRQEAIELGQCACGQPSMRKVYLKNLAEKWGVVGRFCPACAKRERDKVFYRRKLAEMGER